MDSSLRQFVRERAGGICEYCHVPDAYDRLPFQVDHIIAEKHGGPTERENLAWSCYDCNIYKGPNIAGIDPDTDCVVSLFNPRQQTWRDHFVRRGPEIIGSTPTGKATVDVLRINLDRRVAFRNELIVEGVLLLD
jgi:hypothetical protein